MRVVSRQLDAILQVREGRSVREVEVGSKLYKRVWADLIEPVGEVLVKKGVVDGRTERA